jgi:hypothetical protein
MQYRTLTRLIAASKSSNGDAVTVPADLFRKLLIGALRAKNVFDESFYLESYPDIKASVARGVIPSGAEHYYTTGYFEGRRPKKLLVDERFYLEKNPDVATAIRSGKISSAQEHFEVAGFEELRDPYSGFSLF